MTTGRDRELILLPSLTARRGPNGGLVLTRKYLDGAAEYARAWPGPVTSLFRLKETAAWEMDYVEILPDSERHAIELVPDDPLDLRNRLRQAALVFPFLTPFERDTLRLCRELGVPVVFGAEYTLQTSMQIVDAGTRNPLLRWRRKHWTRWAEGERVKMLQHAAGVQCSGTPAYDAYREHNANALLFFDNRVPVEHVISEHNLARRLEDMRQGRALRLVFGGRLVAMKGVMYLVETAAALQQLGVDFTLEIYGHGDLESRLRSQIGKRGLSEHVTLGGVLDFRSGWLPLLQDRADLFLCCHPQGDPSSTYPEVMSCGVPIAGFANEAFSGIVRESGCGWATPLGDTAALAGRVARLAIDREDIATASVQAARFARAHAFEITFARRSEHLIRCSRLPEEVKKEALSAVPAPKPSL